MSRPTAAGPRRDLPKGRRARLLNRRHRPKNIATQTIFDDVLTAAIGERDPVGVDQANGTGSF